MSLAALCSPSSPLSSMTFMHSDNLVQSKFSNIQSSCPCTTSAVQALVARVADQPAHRPRPIPNSYWATPNLLASEYPWTPYDSRPKLDALLKAGVLTFIDLTESGELFPYLPHLAAHARLQSINPSTLEYHRFPIRDRGLPASVDYMRKILDVLRDNEARGRVCVVHCRGGVGRTGMVVGCWLVQSCAVRTGEEALRVIEREWRTVEKCARFPHSPETGPQFDFVKNFVRGRTSSL